MSLTHPWAELVMACLARGGVRDIVVSPGSRSGPLALAAARRGELRVHPVLDERAAAFFALGQARLTGRPSVALSTSGTAAAHHLPAVIEASMARVPLLSLTANRPWELQGSGASQTIDQRRLFGAHARRSLELGPPDEAAFPHVPRLVAEAVAATLGPDPGPVHLDVQLRKPLEATGSPREVTAASRVRELVTRLAPPTRPARVVPTDEELAEAARRLARAERGIIACGPRVGEIDLGEPLARLAELTGFVLYAEATSGARVRSTARAAPTFTALLEAGKAGAAARPDVVVEIGLPLVSAAWSAMLSDTPPRERIVISPAGLLDPLGSATLHLVGDLAWVLERLAALLPRAPARALPTGLLADPPDVPGFHEGAIARAVARSLRDGDTLFVGNSGVTRALDRFAPPLARGVRVLHQRGAAGIDGNVAGLVGAASVTEGPVFGLLGDLALLHDASSLALAPLVRVPTTLVVVDNDGGRLFEALPVARSDEGRAHLDALFVMPPRVDLPALAAAYGVPLVEIEDRDGLDEALELARGQGGLRILRCHVGAPRETGELARLHALLPSA